MATPNNPGNTGRQSLGNSVSGAAANLAGPALDLANGATATQAAGNALSGIMLDKLVGPTAIFAAGMFGVLRTIKAIVDQSGILERGIKRIANIQQIQGKFETLLKSAEKAHARLKDLYKFTASAPFDLSDVAEANRLLEFLTRGALSSARGMKLVGDSAAATGQSMESAAERIGKLYAALHSGRGLDRILFQLQMSGSVTEELASKLETLQQAGAGANEMWAVAETHLLRTEGGMKNEMKTLDGLAKRLKNAGAMMEVAFGTPFVDAQAKAIENSIKATENITPVLAQIGQDLAPVLQLFSNAKNSIVESTLATKGFAEALGAAWEVAKGFAIAITAGSIAAMTAQLGAAGKAVIGFTTSLVGAAKAQAAIGPLSNALFLNAEAAKAMAAGNLLSAASFKAQAIWSSVSTAAIRLHHAALRVATVQTGALNLATYASAMAAGTAAGAWKLIVLAVGKVSAAAATMLAANPVLVIVGAAVAAAYAVSKWADAVKQTSLNYIDLVQNAAKATRALREQADAVRNLDQYRAALAATDKEEEAIKERIRAMGAAPSQTMLAGRLNGRSLGVEEVSNPAYAKFRSDKGVLEDQLKRTRATRARLLSRDPATIGLSGEEQAKLGALTAGELRTADAQRQAGAAGYDEAGRIAFLKSEIARLREEARIGEQIDIGRTSKERLTGETELQKVSREILAAESSGKAVDPALLKRRAELGNMADSWQDKQAQLPALAEEVRSLEETLSLRRLERDLDMEIAEIRARGGETATAEAAKELAILREQHRIAVARGNLVEAAVIAAKIASREADMAKFRTDTALERARNNAIINGKPKAARALQDRADLEKLRDQYRANGMSQGMADSDFAASLRAQAQPRIVADSLQSIGGGGGSAGSSPMLAAQQRIAAMQAVGNAYLKIIAEANTRGDTKLK